MKEYCFEQVFNKKVKLEGIGVELNVNIKDFIDTEKFGNHISEVLTVEKVKEIVRILISCEKSDTKEKDYFIGINPSHY